MCGRYNFTVEQSQEMEEILEKINVKFHGNKGKTGEIFPTDLAPILIEEHKEIAPTLSTWGFPNYNNKGVLINARAETAFEKKTFRESLLSRRCIIPSTGFYEWDSEKRKFLFQQNSTNALYMAGLYNYYDEVMRFVILTTEANESMKDIHHRMPLVIPKEELSEWILDSRITNEILHRVPPLLNKIMQQNEQLSMFEV